ncbi:MAG: NUDIX domain-containing protein [Nanoarchaeota archaeon]|nr:NUDIX domain-containing protein [Nanoarchaeota archaeon]
MEFNITRGLVRYQKRFFLLKRATDPLPENIGKWECPGGTLKGEESPTENVLRECQLELGVSCRVVKELSFFDYHTDTVKSRCHVFLLEAENTAVELTEEHSEWMLVDPQEVQDFDLVLFASLLLEYFRNPEFYGLV